MDPFLQLPCELRQQILCSLGTRRDVDRIVAASPAMADFWSIEQNKLPVIRHFLLDELYYEAHLALEVLQTPRSGVWWDLEPTDVVKVLNVQEVPIIVIGPYPDTATLEHPRKLLSSLDGSTVLALDSLCRTLVDTLEHFEARAKLLGLHMLSQFKTLIETLRNLRDDPLLNRPFDMWHHAPGTSFDTLDKNQRRDLLVLLLLCERRVRAEKTAPYVLAVDIMAGLGNLKLVTR